MVMGLGPAAPSAYSSLEFLDVNTAIEAEATDVNAHGGASGHKIVVNFCYDQGNPNLAAGCARTAVSDGDIAVIAPLIITSDQVTPILQQAGIPYFGEVPISPGDYTNPISLPIAGGVPIDYGAEGYILATRGCKKIGILVTTSYEDAVPYITHAAVTNGAQIVSTETIPVTSVDPSAQIAQIEQAGATCLAIGVNPNQGPPIVQAVNQSGQKLTMSGLTASFPNSLLKSMGAAANGLLLDGAQLLPSDTGNPAIRNMLAVAKEYDPSGTTITSSFATVAWSDAEFLFTKVIPGIHGPVTAAKVIQGIKALKNFSTGVTPSYTGSTAPAIAAYPRLLNYGVTFWKVENGIPDHFTSGFVNIAKSVAS